MAADDTQQLRLSQPRSSTAAALASTRVLSLTGGGYRGLFTAQVLVELCRAARCKGSINATVDVFAGTSIGGLMACALAVGVTPQRVVDAIDANGPRVFTPKRLPTLRRALFGTLYDKGNLAKAIDECLGPHRHTKFKSIEQGLMVPAVDWLSGRVQVYMSGYFGKAYASEVTLREVCLATSAAPTYFDPAEVDGAPMLDGGLAANNPDVLALTEVARRHPGALARIEMLSIGTAGASKARAAKQAKKPGIGWAPSLATYIIDVQERTAADQAARLLGERYLRINHADGRGLAFEEMDIANDETRTLLMKAASDTAKIAYKSYGPFVDRFLNIHRRRATAARS